jgi:benzoate-CoA ligase family protein
MSVELPEQLNIADLFLDARVREGKGDKIAIICGDRRLSYAEVQRLANRFANVLVELGVDPEQRVLIGLPDIPEFAIALFGTLKRGSAVVMVNYLLKPDEIEYFYRYTRAKVAVVAAENLAHFQAAAANAPDLRAILVVGNATDGDRIISLDRRMERASDAFTTYPTHKDDAGIWLFSGGTTGKPKAVVQSHQSFANTTELYAKGVIGYSETDITISVPKLYFGYATGSNLLFTFAGGGTSVIFPERCTAEALFDQIQKHRPTILINVPTMVNNMVSHERAKTADMSSLRLATSAGEALPVELYDRWKATFGVELLDGLGTAEMWHIFVSNRPGDVKPGTLGKAVPGFDVRVRDENGRDLPDGETGYLWVRGASRAVAYWQNIEKTQNAFIGEWYVSGDMMTRDADGYFTYGGRGDDMLKVGGKWLAPGEVENCLLTHPSVKECAVVGVTDQNGLVKPHAYVVAHESRAGLDTELQNWVRDKLEPYKAPRQVSFLDVLPRTHLGKVDRGKLKKL